ncbi:MAG: hypothetical protein R2797_00145 [Gelidibacter sp.]
MVRIINYQKRQAEDGREFFVLEITGGVEFVKSKETGQFYATSKKSSIPSTFDEETCKALIGTEMSGNVEKQEVDPYNYVVKETGEEIILTHRWVYNPEEPSKSKEDNAISQLMGNKASSFSKNGVPELEEQFI